MEIRPGRVSMHTQTKKVDLSYLASEFVEQFEKMVAGGSGYDKKINEQRKESENE